MAAGIRIKNRVLLGLLALGLSGTLYLGNQLWNAGQFNQAVAAGAIPKHPDFIFESRYAAAYAFAVNGRYHDAAQLYNQLLELQASPEQIAAVHYNLGNIFLLRGLMVNRSGGTVRDEAEYLFNQARLAYQQSLRLDPHQWDARHNLDRVLSMLPEKPTENEQEKPGIVMGNIPTGLP